MSMSKSKVPDIDFDESTEEVKKFITYKRVTFYVTDGPKYPGQVRNYVEQLKANHVKYIIRTNYSHYNTNKAYEQGIEVLDIDFTSSEIPDEEVMNTFASQLQAYRVRRRGVSIAVQGYDNGPFVIVFGLMNLGMTRMEALAKVREVDGEASFYQIQYLKKKEPEISMQLDFNRRFHQASYLPLFEGCVIL